MSGFGFYPNDGFFDASAAGDMNAPMLQPGVMREAARKFLAAHNDLPVGREDMNKVQEALNIANTWIEERTQFPATVTNSDIAWSRKDWVDQSINGWQKLVEPLANGMVEALGKVLKEMGPDAGFLPVMRSFMGQLIATQLGQSIGALAIGVTGSQDAAVPLFDKSGAHLLPQNMKLWGEGLEIPEQEIAIYMALREVAAQRLFAHTPWLPNYIRDLIESYGRGITVDVESIQRQAESAMDSGELDINNPESITMAINQGMFQPEQSTEQTAALAKLEITFALIEGWIDHVTHLSGQDRLPSLAALEESYRRARIESAPTQQLFSMLLGLQISPRMSRECSQFWNEIYVISGGADGGISVRDHRWEDPTLLPTTEDISDPAKFLASTTVPDDLSGLI
jgi:putative hydrolase